MEEEKLIAIADAIDELSTSLEETQAVVDEMHQTQNVEERFSAVADSINALADSVSEIQEVVDSININTSESFKTAKKELNKIVDLAAERFDVIKKSIAKIKKSDYDFKIDTLGSELKKIKAELKSSETKTKKDVESSLFRFRQTVGSGISNILQAMDLDSSALADGYVIAWDSALNKFKMVAQSGGGAVDSVNGQTGVVVLTTNDVAEVSDKKYLTNAEETKLANTSGTNTGDETTATIKTKLGITTLSGSNTGDQTSIVGITGTKAQFNTAVTDGDILYVGDVTSNATHTGEVTGATALTIATAAVTNAKLANMATKTYKGRTSAGTGVPEDVSVATLKTDLALVKADVGLGNVDNTSNATERAATRTLTNARITKRTGTATSSATPTINTDNVDFYSLTAQAVDITSFTTNLSGTPTQGQTLWIAITGTAARAITWGASFEESTIALPTTTVLTNRLDVGFVYNTVSGKWRCVATC